MNTPPKKLILLTDCFPRLQSGAEKQIYELVKRLDLNKYTPIVVSLESVHAAPSDVVSALGCEFHRFPVKRIYGLSGFIQGLKFYRFLRAASVQRSAVSNNPPTREPANSLTSSSANSPTGQPANTNPGPLGSGALGRIVVTYHFSSDIWGTFWAHLAGVKTIISNRRDMGFWRGKQHIWAYKLINRWVTKVIVVATAVKEMVVREENYPADKVEVIYNGVDFAEVTGHRSPVTSQNLSGTLGSWDPGVQIREKLGLKVEDIVIMCVGTLWPVKGHSYLIEAVANVKSQIPNIKLVLVGSGELEDELKELAGKLGLWGGSNPASRPGDLVSLCPGDLKNDAVIFLGKRSDARALLAAADICVLPSLSEGMSNAVLEYMAAGKPVVATRVGGNPELVVDGVTGILVDKGNSDQLAGALLRLISNPEDRRLMGEAGFKRVQEQFLMTTMINRYEKLFSELTSKVANR